LIGWGADHCRSPNSQTKKELRMSNDRIRALSQEELVVSGRAQVDIIDMGPIEVRPPEDDGWPEIAPPDTTAPYDPGPGDRDGGGDGGQQVSGDSSDFKSSATLDGNGVATATPSWTNPGYNLAFNMDQRLNLTNMEWGLAGSGSFLWNGNTYSIALNSDQFNISGASASLVHDYGGGLKFEFNVGYDTNTGDYSGKVSLIIPTGP
jgi:hypothetical protein